MRDEIYVFLPVNSLFYEIRYQHSYQISYRCWYNISNGIFLFVAVLGMFLARNGDTPNIFDHKQIVCPDLMRPWSEKTGLGKITIVIRIQTINYYFLYWHRKAATAGSNSGHGRFSFVPLGQNVRPKLERITHVEWKISQGITDRAAPGLEAGECACKTPVKLFCKLNLTEY